MFNRYLRSAKYVRNSLEPAEVAKYERTVALFRKYGDRYGFDSLMLTAQGYQESQLDRPATEPRGRGRRHADHARRPARRCRSGTSTSWIPTSMRATKYLRFMVDRYFKDAPMEPTDKMLFAFASYNAGPAKVARLRKEAKQAGLDPNVWFNNVELIAAKRIGRETVQYVSNIFKYYVAYKLLEDERDGAGPRKATEARRLGPTRPGYNPRVMAHDLVVRGGTVVTATETLRCDVGIDGGRISALGSALPSGRREIDARGLSCSRAASTATSISSSSPRWASCAPTISTPRPCPRRSAARRP